MWSVLVAARACSPEYPQEVGHKCITYRRCHLLNIWGYRIEGALGAWPSGYPSESEWEKIISCRRETSHVALRTPPSNRSLVWYLFPRRNFLAGSWNVQMCASTARAVLFFVFGTPSNLSLPREGSVLSRYEAVSHPVHTPRGSSSRTGCLHPCTASMHGIDSRDEGCAPRVYQVNKSREE